MAQWKTGTGLSASSHLTIGLFAGLLVGVLVGLIECAWLMYFGSSAVSHGTLLYALILYPLQFIPAGLVAGLLPLVWRAVRGRPALGRKALYAFVTALLLTPTLVFLARMRVGKDLLFNAPFPMWGSLVLLVALVPLFFAVLFMVRTLIERTPFRFLAHARGTVIVLTVLLASAFALSLTGGRAAELDELRAPAPTAADGRTPAPHILLIMVDTLRADRLSCYDYGGNQTPAIDALARDSILFRFTIAQAAWTRPATASLLTSLHPDSHKANELDQQLPDELTTLPEALTEQGYRTVGCVNNINVNRSFNFHQGFNEFTYLAPNYLFLADESSSKLLGHWLMRKVRKLVDRSRRVEEFYQDADMVNEHLLAGFATAADSRPTFYFVQYMDPHDPYFAHPYNGEALNLVETPDPGPDRVEEVSQLYDGEVSFLDSRLETVFQRMRELGIYDNTLIILTADHGEELYDHRGWFHGSTLYQELIQVPLIIKLPGNRLAGNEVEQLTRQVDIAATILGQVDLLPPAAFQGIDVVTALAESRDDESAPVSWPVGHITAKTVFRGTELHSLIAGDWKLVRASKGNARGLPQVELFRLDQDLAEQRDLSAEHPERVSELEKLLDAELAAALATGAREAQSQELDEATRARLEALGYLD